MKILWYGCSLSKRERGWYPMGPTVCKRCREHDKKGLLPDGPSTQAPA